MHGATDWLGASAGIAAARISSGCEPHSQVDVAIGGSLSSRWFATAQKRKYGHLSQPRFCRPSFRGSGRNTLPTLIITYVKLLLWYTVNGQIVV